MSAELFRVNNSFDSSYFDDMLELKSISIENEHHALVMKGLDVNTYLSEISWKATRPVVIDCHLLLDESQ